MSNESPLYPVLETFAARVNTHERIPRLLVGWDRTIVLEAMDTGASATIVVQGQRIVELRKSAADGDITVQADEAVLTDIFAGKSNPAQAVLEGGLAVFGDEKDQIKLDAITLVLWGS